MLYRGMLVALPQGRGVGKLEGVEDGTCKATVFRSITLSETICFPLTELERAYLSPQTRVYVREEDRFRVGRVADFLAGDNGLIEYEVRFPNGKRADFSELALYVRPWSAPENPAEVLANGGAESQFLHDRRQAAMLPLLKLRGAAQGMTALVSAGIDLAPHQVAAVRRVLTDPVQRYLLADEVGLGKTIEAGLIIRQHLIDRPDTSVLVVVPAHLCDQWRGELRTKLRIDQFDGHVEVIAHADLARVKRAPDILVIDEAHHLVGVETGRLAPSAARLGLLAQQTPVLLLLSATPPLGDEGRFLALLNLLDPASHPLDDLDGFRRKLEGRREIGRLLLALDPDGSKLVLRHRASELERLFPNDAVIADLVPQLVAATRDAPDDLPKLCSALKTHVADSYRIHQRLIRSRRADAQGWEFAARGPTDDGALSFPHVRTEADEGGWTERLLATLEEWRFSVLEAAQGEEVKLDAAARRYAGLLGAVAAGRAAILTWALASTAVALSSDEKTIVDRLRKLAEEAEDDPDVEVACESTRRLVRSLRTEGVAHPKIVAFASEAELAAEFRHALGDTLDRCEVLALDGRDDEPNQASVARFTLPRTTALLICDRNGEEGLNLACADAIVHLDLPLSAARIEQRIGRLDRFGRRQAMVRHRVVLPSDEEDSPWAGWFDFLASGLGIFHRSLSDVQFLLDGFELRLFRELLERGSQGVADLSAAVRAEIQDERLSQDEQYALDRIALAEEPVEALLDALESAEEDEAALEEGIDGWLVGALQLKKRPYAWPEQDPFKLGAAKDTLIPKLPWLEAFDLQDSVALTWRRRIATNHPEATLLRPGTPLIDTAERFTRWDDRGTAFITWRTAPEWTGDLWLGFRLCLVVEPDIPIADLFAPSRAELAKVRRAQRFLAPRAYTVHVDADGDIVTDPQLTAILDRPYTGADAGRAAPDLNLSSRPHLLAGVVEPGQFATLCRSVRDRARDRLLAEPALNEAITAGTRSATAEVARRRERLQRRQSAGDGDARADLAAFEAILPAIANPTVRLDAMGCFLVSRDRNQASTHG